MDRNKYVVFFIVLAALAIFLIGPNALAQEVDTGPYAELSLNEKEITWELSVETNGAILSISGPQAFTYTQTFPLDVNPVFPLATSEGDLLPDGTYWYELRLLPVLTEEIKAPLSEMDEDGRAETIADLQAAGFISSQGRVQVGSFKISGGVVVPRDASEGGPLDIQPMDVPYYDDVIIDGNLCVGLDCVLNEDFGFTTQLFKENNLRMMFQDTSTSASFPNNDWAFIINESANGGADYFAISDCGASAGNDAATCTTLPFLIQAGAPANTLTIESTGDIGIDTANPALELQIHDGDSPGIRFDQSGGGWGTYAWDIAANETNFFIRDVTSGSTLPFKIRPGAPSNSLYIQTGGNIGIGTSNPQEKLHLASGNLLVEGNVMLDGYVTEHSDVNAKENFIQVDPDEILALVTTLPLSTWNYKAEDPAVRHIGPMAQDFFATFALGADETHIAPLDTNGVALAAIQALTQDLQTKESEIEALKEQNAALAVRLTALEQAVGAQDAAANPIQFPVLIALTMSGLFLGGWWYAHRWKQGGVQ